MPSNKHKRKTAANFKNKLAKKTKPSGIISAHPKASVGIGLLFVSLGVYLLTFESQDNAMFGLAMLSLVVGIAMAIYGNLALSRKK